MENVAEEIESEKLSRLLNSVMAFSCYHPAVACLSNDDHNKSVHLSCSKELRYCIVLWMY